MIAAVDTDLGTLRAALGWSQYHLARQIGCSRGLVDHWESGRRPTPAGVLDYLRRCRDAMPPPPPESVWRERRPTQTQ